MSSSSSTVSHPSASESGIGSLGPPKVPFLIGVAGGTASGKSTVCRKIMDKLGKDAVERQQRVVCISQDSFYRELNEVEKEEALKGNHNFDHPDALDIDLMQRILKDILRGKEVQIPVYDFTLNMRFVYKNTLFLLNLTHIFILFAEKLMNSSVFFQLMLVSKLVFVFYYYLTLIIIFY